jgi:hypothetical protein
MRRSGRHRSGTFAGRCPRDLYPDTTPAVLVATPWSQMLACSAGCDRDRCTGESPSLSAVDPRGRLPLACSAL